MKRPNILFLMTDQHRWDALGCVNPVVQTPNLDLLAGRGVRFSQAVCNAPMCVPSRYSMMLGLYPSQCGVRHNTQFCPTDHHLPLPMLPQRLHELGYQTAGFGKTHWYLGSRHGKGIPADTSRRGFEIKAQARVNDPQSRQPAAICMGESDPDALRALSEETRSFGGGGEGLAGYLGCSSSVSPDRHREGWLTGQTLKFLEKDRDASRPLFLYLSFDFPHAGFNVPAEYERLYDISQIPDFPEPPWAIEPQGHVESDWRREEWNRLPLEDRRRSVLRYYALCTYVDAMFGLVLNKLGELGELENTLVLFTSDHGEMLGQRGGRFSKYCLYEGSVRVPLILAGAGVTRHGEIDDRPAELVDILPTLLTIAGASVPPELPGRFLLHPSARPGSFCEMHGLGYERVQRAPAYMWRTSHWKLILYLDGTVVDADLRVDEGKGELYKLSDDPGEWTNLYDDPSCLQMRDSLTRQLLLHLAGVWARYPFQPSRSAIVPLPDNGERWIDLT